MHFVPNWTGPEFVVFVDELEALVADIWAEMEAGTPSLIVRAREGGAAAQGVKHDDLVAAPVQLDTLHGLWDRVLRIEAEFWPSVDGVEGA